LAISEPYINRFSSNLNCTRQIKCQKKIYLYFQKWFQNGGLKLEFPITEPFMSRFGSKLNYKHKISCLKIIVKNFQNGGQNGGPDGGSKL